MTTKPAADAPTHASASAMPYFEDLPSLQLLGLNNLAAFGREISDAWGETGAEVMSFLAERIKEDVKTQHEVLHCKDVKDLRTIQANFFATAIEQYTAETGKLVSMNQGRLIAALSSTDEAKKKA